MTRASKAMAAAFLAVLALNVTACATRPPAPLDVLTVAECEHETGPFNRQSDPCVWDSDRQGQHPGGSPVRWVLYWSTCPVTTVQDYRIVECVPRSQWGE